MLRRVRSEQVLRKLTIPMIFGILGMVAFNLADTYFVSQLGVLQVAALSFTFPVVLVIGSLNMGIGIGASVVISNAVGGKAYDKVKRLSTDGLSLGVVISVTIMIVGMLTIEPLFRLLGADDATMPYIVEYMRVWYIGVPFVVIPQIGNNAIRALGDTKTPSIIMLIAAGMNVVLDPLLIFGIGFFPQMGRYRRRFGDGDRTGNHPGFRTVYNWSDGRRLFPPSWSDCGKYSLPGNPSFSSACPMQSLK